MRRGSSELRDDAGLIQVEHDYHFIEYEYEKQSQIRNEGKASIVAASTD
jgi:hypothetical protein